MKKSQNKKVSAFISELQSTSPEKHQMVESIRKIFLKTNKDFLEDIKYGGLVFNLSANLIGGIFVYKEHISIEFSNGVELPDPFGLLEGKGKKRRHLKIFEQQDIENKKVSFFVDAISEMVMD